ncbi:MAG TPA: chromosome segregation protein SMC [Bacillota bacterium]|nr:chromosome segregation protein SMC [Bacillota bacterium]HPZ55192.1 chromosome segregation protein SMC [Bacillota bacterium]
MYLKRLEMTGFKSFPDHIALEFLRGVTAIVGPNGSGKSNISDAIRWVLGEHNPRVLRGSKMEDVIFGGSDKRRALGAAEVTLVLDNKERRAPLDCEEIRISRRMYRSGESEYLLNNSICRLKDIRDLFLDTGLGRNSYAIVEQGRVDAILNARPDERRAFFDEAAGVAKCKARKQEALSKLDDAERNLVRVWDLINELSVRVETMRGQAEKAKTYMELYGELADLETGLLGNRFLAGKARLDALGSEMNDLNARHAAVLAQVTKAEAELAQMREEVAAMDARSEADNARLTEVVAAIERCDGRQAVARERIKLLEQERDRLARERQDVEVRLSRLNSQLAQERRKLEDVRLRAATLARQLKSAENEMNEFTGQVAAMEQSIEDLKGKIVGVVSEMAEHRNALSDFRARLEAGQRNSERLNERLEQVRAALKSVSANADSLEQRLKEVSAERSQFERRSQELRNTRDEIDRQLAELLEAADKKRRMLARAESRLAALKDLDRSYEGFFAGVRAVLERYAGTPGLLGVVADLIKVAPKYVQAIESALGSALQNVVVESDVIARQCVQFLKEHNRGRATFLPLDLIRVPSTERLAERIKPLPGVIGVASSLVEVPSQAKSAIDHLLGRTVIAVDLDAAVNAARALRGAARVVTLDGDIVSQGGAITGGSRTQNDRGILARKSEIDQLTEQTDQMQEDLLEHERLVAEARQARASLESDIDSIGEAQKNADLSIAELNGRLESTKKDIERLLAEERLIRDEQADLEQGLERYRTNIVETEEQLERLALTEKALEGDLQQQQALLKSRQAGKDEIVEKITGLRVEVGKCEQEVNAQRATVERLDLEAVSLRSRLDELDGLSSQNQRAIEEADVDIEVALRDRQRLESEKAGLNDQLSRSKGERLEIASRISEREITVREARRELNGLAKDLSKREVEMARVSESLSAIAARLREDYMLDLDSLEIRDLGMDEAGASARIETLRQSIRDLGPVNTAAVEEFEETRERYEFLCSQRDDLVNAKRSLTEVISEIDQEMERRFRETFDVVNEHFKEMFAKLFQGGRAELVLENPDDLLSTGVEIYAEPPGKKLQSLSLLSGGERALTAIALIFAMMKANPSPFAVLDEIDAPLDDANVSRFTRVLRELAQSTQFVVVTHRKGTMEAADALYGVTMEESGVSKVVSVKLQQ